MKNFKKRERLAGGTENTPYYEEYGKYRCFYCNIDAKEINKKERYTTEAWPGGGKIGYSWSEITLQCPKCNKKEIYDTPTIESDASYYSNEECRIYGY